jgi:hypothetical protein
MHNSSAAPDFWSTATGADDQKIGTVQRVMSGKVAYESSAEYGGYTAVRALALFGSTTAATSLAAATTTDSSATHFKSSMSRRCIHWYAITKAALEEICQDG